MNIVAIGVNHKTAPIDIREKFFLNPAEQDLLLSELKCNPAILEAFVLSTCNRTEIYAHVLPHNKGSCFPYFIRLFSDIRKIPFDRTLSRIFYTYTDREAVRHLARVATGLDSLVLGEKQILGQVKAAVERARARGMLSKGFNILTNVVIRAGKKAQHETDISFGGSSIGWAAVMMAEQLLGSLERKSMVIIGAGKMGELTLDQLRNKGIEKIYLMNRTQATAEKLAGEYGVIPAAFCDVKEILSEVDICLCAACAPHYILDKEILEKVLPLRKGRRIVLIDISMPRNIDPAVAGLEPVHLSHIDDLKNVVEETRRKRLEAVNAVEKIIEDKLNSFERKLAGVTDWEDTIPLTPGHAPAGRYRFHE